MDKDKFKNLKNFIKEEEPQRQRLQSLKLPRDLSLGGTKPKKVYTPNINAVRNKDKTKEVFKKLERKRKEKFNANENRNRQGNYNQRYVQSTGVFSEGAGELRRPQRNEKRVSFRDADSVSNMILPTIKRNNWAVNKKAEDVVLDELINHEDDIVEEFMNLKPISWVKEKENAVKAKEDIKNETEVPRSKDPQTEVPSFFKSEPFDDDNLGISVIKLPDSFAGKGLSDDPNIKQIFDFPLNAMLEGRIGTLSIRKSGKMQMTVGKVTYDIESEDFFNAREEVAVISKDDAPTASILGKVQQRLILNPIWDKLLTT